MDAQSDHEMRPSAEEGRDRVASSSLDEVVTALAPLRFLKLRFVLKAVSPLVLPAYKGSTFRGAFGIAFKQAVCVNESSRRDCGSCSLRYGCPYPYVFDTPTSILGSTVRGHTAAPHPFVMLPPLEAKTHYEPGEHLATDLVLIGQQAVQLLSYFVYVFEWMGRRTGLGRGRGRFQVEEVRALAREGDWSTIYSRPALELRVPPETLEIGDLVRMHPDLSSERLAVRFVTPCRLVSDGKLVNEPGFELLVRALLRRFDDLARYHCGRGLGLDFRRIVGAAAHVRLSQNDTVWFDWERYSKRQDSRMKLGGLVGQAVYEGELGSFLPLLMLAEVLHVGKNTAFGLGKVVVER